MTNKQFDFIEGLLKKKEYDYNNQLVSAFKSGYDLSTKDASNLIDYLLGCADHKEEKKEVKPQFKIGQKVRMEDDFGDEMIGKIVDVNVWVDYRKTTHILYNVDVDGNLEEGCYEDELTLI